MSTAVRRRGFSVPPAASDAPARPRCEEGVRPPRLTAARHSSGIRKRLLLGLLMALFAIMSGWVLVPPEAGTDQATVEWYTQ